MLEVFSLKNKTIVITGASSGIGRECAIVCSRLGANLAIIGRNVDELNRTKELCGKGEVFPYVVDIAEVSVIEKLVGDIAYKQGKIDGFIHSAGIGMTKPLKILKGQDYEKVIKINAISAFEFVKILSKKKFLPEGGASYVLISSVMGVLGDIGNVAYCASKSALLATAKAMALELASKNIRVNSVLPGVVKTDMSKKLFESITLKAKQELLGKHPLGFGTPVDIANSCAFLLSNASQWITGANFVVDGGYSCH